MTGNRPARPDRRIQRTRLALHRALVQLMVEKGYESVTVQDIIDRANTGRSTFYAHFTSKDDLLRSGLRDLSFELASHQRAAAAMGDSAEARFAFSRALFEHALLHQRTYLALVGRRSGALVIGELQKLLADLVRKELARHPAGKRAAGIPRPALVAFVVGALMAVLTWWLDEKARLPAAEADAIFRTLVIAAVFH